MTSKENAERLVSQFYPILGGVESKDWEYFHKETAKKCALVCVEEVLRLINDRVHEWSGWDEERQFWEDTKTEIEKL